MCVAALSPLPSPLYLPRMGHLCDVPCKILQLLASERARSNFDASLTRVDSRAGILAPPSLCRLACHMHLGRYFMWWGNRGREVLLPTLCSSRALAFGVGSAVSAASLLPYFVVLARFCFCVFCCLFFALGLCVCECVFILAIKCMRRMATMALMAALGS